MPPLAFASASAIPAGLWRWPHIDPAHEWADQPSGTILIVPEFLDRLEALRGMVGVPLVFSSCYRTPAHNQIVSATSSDDGPHTLALAADILTAGPAAFELVRHALTLGFTGIGIAQKGEVAKRFVHVDCAPGKPTAPRPLIWSY